MEPKSLSCVICKNNTNDKVIIFNDERLRKCRNILKIRQENDLKFAKVILPSDVTTTKGYHAQCYRYFSALMRKYRENVSTTHFEPSTSSSGDLLLMEHIVNIQNVQSTRESNDDLENHEDAPEASGFSETTQQLENQDDQSKTSENVCLFCTKFAKRWKGRTQSLCVLDKASLKRAVEPFLNFVVSSEVYNKLEESGESAILKAHRICRKEYIYSLQSLQDKPQTNYHKKLGYREQGFEDLCNFIEDNIIANNKCYFFTFLCNYYVDAIKKIASEDGHNYDNTLSKANFESKLKKKYEGEIKFSILHNQKIVGPINREINDHSFSLL